MEQPTNYIVFLCYGNGGTLYECAYSLLSLSRLYTVDELKNTEIWIYTDQPDFFRSFKGCKLPLHYRQLDAATIKQWRGEINFSHRMKIEMLRDLTTDRTGSVFYVDSDSVFTQRIDHVWDDISNGELYMHLMEGKVSGRGNKIFEKLDDHLSKTATEKINGKPVNDLAMWNAGVLGFDTKYRYLLDEALAYTDKEYPKFSKHIVEQFAFSRCFQKEGNVKAAALYILHYWILKEARTVLHSFFEHFKESNWNELVVYSQLVQLPVLLQEKINFLNNRTLFQSMIKRQWLPPKYDWAEMMKQI